MSFNDIKKNFGFGCMRLKMNDDKVDYDEFNRMIDAFIGADEFMNEEEEQELVASLVREEISIEEAHEALTDEIAVHFVEVEDSHSGKRYQSKRNFVNRFWANHPDCRVLPLEESTLPAVEQLLDEWYLSRVTAPGDFHLEQVAIRRGFDKMDALGLEGIVLMEDGKALAMTMGSFLCDTTFDIHFEKAADGVDGAYAAINQSFAKHLMDKYPQLSWLNREDDLGIEGLRKAKLSYHPDHLVEKYWARLWEDADES